MSELEEYLSRRLMICNMIIVWNYVTCLKFHEAPLYPPPQRKKMLQKYAWKKRKIVRNKEKKLGRVSKQLVELFPCAAYRFPSVMQQVR